MSRDGGFPVADVATGHFNDPKVRKLWRILGDPDAMARAMTLHFAVVLTSWGEGRRVTVDEAAPVWLSVSPETIAALRSAGLIDRQGRLPRRSWDGWYGPAFDRRTERAFEGTVGGLMRSLGLSKPEAVAEAKRRLRATSGPPRSGLAFSVPTVPTVPTVARAPARRGGGAARNEGPTSLAEALAGTPLGESIAAKGGR